MLESKKLKIRLKDLKFDEMNPRLPSHLQGVLDEDQIIDHMIRTGNIIELMFSIAETGYSDAEPLLVVKDHDDKYIVVEGNRRLAALRLLDNPALAKVRIQSIQKVISEAKNRPTEIPCVSYDKREDVLDYLGYRHITGVKSWGALEKARYLDYLYQIHIQDGTSDKIYRKLAKMIGSRSDYVAKLHTAFKLYKEANDNAYYGLDIREQDINFSWLTTAVGYSSISDYIGLSGSIDISMDTLDEGRFEKLFTWMFRPEKSVVKEAREISKLAKITEYPSALERLEKGSTLDEALLYTSAPRDAFIQMLKTAKQQLKQARDAIEQLMEEPHEAQGLLKEIEKILKTISGGLEKNFRRSNEDIDFLDKLSANPQLLLQLKEMLDENKG